MYWRRLPKFEYLAPKSIEEATSMLKEHKGEAGIMAGGTIVIHNMKERIGVRRYLIGLKAIPNLDFIAFDEAGGLRIGCMASLQSVADSPVLKDRFENLAVACGKLGTPQIRNMGSLGGNLCCRFPTAEAVPALVALDAKAKITTASGDKTVAVEALYKELKGIELVTEIHVPIPPQGAKGSYQKYTIREGMDYATVCAAVQMTLTNGRCQDIRIALGGATLPSMRSKRAEEIIRGQSLTDSVVEKVAQAASEDAKTASDIYFSADYKKELLKGMVKRAIKETLKA
jgi:CO/xanthine dehydrogenase FAD-binding subunit